MLRSDLDAPKKQRDTARRILARLVDEHGAAGLSYSTVRDHVRSAVDELNAGWRRPMTPTTPAVSVTEPPASARVGI